MTYDTKRLIVMTRKKEKKRVKWRFWFVEKLLCCSCPAVFYSLSRKIPSFELKIFFKTSLFINQILQPACVFERVCVLLATIVWLSVRPSSARLFFSISFVFSPNSWIDVFLVVPEVCFAYQVGQRVIISVVTWS